LSKDDANEVGASPAAAGDLDALSAGGGCSKLDPSGSSAPRSPLYCLSAVVCHKGDISGGHYISYVKVRRKQHQPGE